MDLDLPPGYRNHIVVDFTFLEVGIDTHQLNVPGSVFQAAAMFDDLFHADTSPSCSTDCALAPLCLLAWVSNMERAS